MDDLDYCMEELSEALDGLNLRDASEAARRLQTTALRHPADCSESFVMLVDSLEGILRRFAHATPSLTTDPLRARQIAALATQLAR